MKLITAIIQPDKLTDVKKALTEKGINGLTVSDVQGYGKQKGFTQVYHGHEYKVNLRNKVKIEIFVTASQLLLVIDAIIESAKTNGGATGDGKIIVTPIEECIRIRTGEKGEKAI